MIILTLWLADVQLLKEVVDVASKVDRSDPFSI